MRRNGEAGVSRGTAPRLRNGIRLQADMRPARATLIGALRNSSAIHGDSSILRQSCFKIVFLIQPRKAFP
jgi:hypothetical protein